MSQRLQIPICFLAWLTVVLLVGLALEWPRSPRPMMLEAGSQELSAERAMKHVKVIARLPHPVGSQANQAVRDYLMGQLSSMGFAPQVFSGVGLDVVGGTIAAGRTQDVVGRVNGAANSRAILLIAHYDSVSRAPGAGDDAAGVAAILEAVRAVRAERALDNDLIVLFSDGEEGLLLGAESFAMSHPWMKDVGLVLNFEARGNRGASLLFETSSGNHQLVTSVREAAPYPVGSSLFYALYKMLPNDTDFTIFHRLGIPGLNFAFGEGFDAYHSRLDTAENLSTASLQHHGSYALALVRYFGRMDLTKLQKPTGDDIFFNWLGAHLIAYPESWVMPEQILISIFAGMLVIVAVRKANTQPKRLLLAILAWLVLLAFVPAVMAFIWKITSYVLAGRLVASDLPGNSLLLMGTVLSGTIAAGFLLHMCRKKFSGQEMSLAAILVLCSLNWVVVVKFRGGSYLIFWPLLFCVVGHMIIQRLNREDQPLAQLIASLTGTSVALLLFAPFVDSIYIFFTLQPLAIMIIGVCIGLVCMLSIPLIDRLILKTAPWATMAIVSGAAIACWGAGARLSGYTPEHPGRDTLAYSVDANDGSATWISYDDALDGWTGQLFKQGAKRQSLPNYLAGSTRPVIAAPTPAMKLAAPLATIQALAMSKDLYRLNLKVKSPRAADVIYLRFAPSIQGVSAEIEGRHVQFQKSTDSLRLTLYGMTDDEVDLKFMLRAPSGIAFWLMDQTTGFPVTVPARPGNMTAWYGSDVTLVCRMYKL
jgi:hypothetical protein